MNQQLPALGWEMWSYGKKMRADESITMARNRGLKWGIHIRRMKEIGDMGPGILAMEILEFFFSSL